MKNGGKVVLSYDPYGFVLITLWDITRTADINQLLVTVAKKADLNEFIFHWNFIYFHEGPVH